MQELMKIVLEKNAIMPTRAHADDAGADLYAPEDIEIPERSYCKVSTGIRVQIPVGYVGRMASKSGLMAKGITVMGGEIDAGYTGIVSAVLRNENPYPFRFERGQKICQLIIEPVITPALVEVDSLEDTERGEGGFGSTGA